MAQGEGEAETTAGRFPLPPGEGQGEGEHLQCGCLCYLWLQRSLRSRLIACVMLLMAQGAASRRRPLYPRDSASTGSFSGPMSGGDSHIGSGPRRPGKRSATRQNNGVTGLPGRLSMLACRRCAWGDEPTGGPRRLGNAISRYPDSWIRPGYPTGRIRRHARLSPAPRRPA